LKYLIEIGIGFGSWKVGLKEIQILRRRDGEEG
jgi:hypothetical protein